MVGIAAQADLQRRPLIPEHRLPLRYVWACHNGGCCPPDIFRLIALRSMLTPQGVRVTEHVDPRVLGKAGRF